MNYFKRKVFKVSKELKRLLTISQKLNSNFNHLLSNYENFLNNNITKAFFQ